MQNDSLMQKIYDSQIKKFGIVGLTFFNATTIPNRNNLLLFTKVWKIIKEPFVLAKVDTEQLVLLENNFKLALEELFSETETKQTKFVLFFNDIYDNIKLLDNKHRHFEKGTFEKIVVQYRKALASKDKEMRPIHEHSCKMLGDSICNLLGRPDLIGTRYL